MLSKPSSSAGFSDDMFELNRAGVEAVAFGVLGFFFLWPPADDKGDIILIDSESVVSPETTIFGASSEIDILQCEIDEIFL